MNCPDTRTMRSHMRMQGVWLKRDNNDIVVYVLHEQKWYEAIREPFDADIDHCEASKELKNWKPVDSEST